MELGKGKLLRTGLNTLYQATHPTYGLAWTDGNQVVLTDLQLQSGQAKFGDSRVIGQFEHVCGLSWAPPGIADLPTLLAVQHKKHITVWQLGPSTVESSTLSQTCEIIESHPVLPQGCMWHPKHSVLTVLTAQNVSIFPNVHCDNSRVKVDIDTQGRIHCACWTQDGQRLVVAVGNSLHSYIWDSAQKTLHRCYFCPVLDMDSYVRSITATVDSQVALTTELPLDKICSLNASEAIDVPPHGDVSDHMPPVDKWATVSEMSSGIAISPSFSEPLDLTHVRFNQPKDEENFLICLRKQDYLTGTGQDSSHLVLVTFKKATTMTRKVAIPGLLVPDLIAFNLRAQIVAVASNTCNIILIYSIIPSSMPNIQQIQLENSERPKGICFLTDKLLLISVGIQNSTETAFLPSSESDQYNIRLIVREVILGEECSVTCKKRQSAYSALNTQLNKAEREKLIESLSPDFGFHTRQLLLTANTSSQSRLSERPLIKEIKSPSSTISDGSIVLDTLHRPSWVWTTLPRPSRTPDHTSTPDLPNLPQRENFKKENEIYQLSKEVEILTRNLIEMKQYIFELLDFIHTEKKSSPVYPLSRDPPYVHLIYQKPCSVDPAEKKTVLLCDGKLRLSTVQQTFGLSLVEMLH
uniref:WD repeat and coiled-coil-containing protein n=1 Tax=Jaculus jaculus TaxID=51337 RepID=A0A8C5LGX6_JACJA